MAFDVMIIMIMMITVIFKLVVFGCDDDHVDNDGDYTGSGSGGCDSSCGIRVDDDDDNE